MRESTVEKYFRESVESAGGMCIKFTSPSHRGVPDRIVVHPNCGVVFVELKAPGEKPRKQQIIRQGRIRKAGGAVFVVDSYEETDKFMEFLRNSEGPQKKDTYIQDLEEENENLSAQIIELVERIKELE